MSEPKKILLSVRVMSGSYCSVEVDPSRDTVDTIKDFISKKEGLGIRPEQQRLFYCGVLLEKERTLADYGIGAESTGSSTGVVLLPRLPESGFTISIKTVKTDHSSTSVDLNVTSTDTAGKVKQMLQDKLGIVHPDHQRLIHTWRGQAYDLQDDQVLSRYPIAPNEAALVSVSRRRLDTTILVKSLDHKIVLRVRVTEGDTLQQVLCDIKETFDLSHGRKESHDVDPYEEEAMANALDHVGILRPDEDPKAEHHTLFYLEGTQTPVSPYEPLENIIPFHQQQQRQQQTTSEETPPSSSSLACFELGRKAPKGSVDVSFFSNIKDMPLAPRQQQTLKYDMGVARLKDLQVDLWNLVAQNVGPLSPRPGFKIFVQRHQGEPVPLSLDSDQTLAASGIEHVMVVDCSPVPSKAQHIYVKTVAGKLLGIQMTKDDTVADLKGKIADEWGFRPELQRIIFVPPGAEQPDSVTLDGLENEATVRLVLRLRQGGPEEGRVLAMSRPTPTVEDDSEFIIFVKWVGPPLLINTVKPTDTLETLSLVLAREIGNKRGETKEVYECTRLVFKGKPLVEGQSLSDHGIQSGDTVYLVIPMR